jgi:recombination protein RecR
LPSPLDQLTSELAKLPGIGHKTAMRLALFIIRQNNGYPDHLSSAIKNAAGSISTCKQCYHITSQNLCEFCADSRRDQGLICVVEESQDLFALEKTNGFKGRYHILQGALSPLDGIGPNELTISSLLKRISTEEVTEVILATNPTVTGDATALYLSKLLKPLSIKVTKLASGIPVGSGIEYIDAMTLTKALEHRVEY